MQYINTKANRVTLTPEASAEFDRALRGLRAAAPAYAITYIVGLQRAATDAINEAYRLGLEEGRTQGVTAGINKAVNREIQERINGR